MGFILDENMFSNLRLLHLMGRNWFFLRRLCTFLGCSGKHCPFMCELLQPFVVIATSWQHSRYTSF